MSQPQELTRLIPLANLEPNGFNPRRSFDKDELAELAESIKAHGILEPLIVRPIGFPGVDPAKHRFEIVAGERRFRAAKLAKLPSVPCLVKPIGDREALEIAVVENEQRADVAPLDKARGYAMLVNDHGVDVDELAGRVGKSTSTIRALLRLTRLPKLAADALTAGTISASVAELIARIPGDEARAEAAKLAIKAQRSSIGSARTWNPWKDRPLTYRDTKEMIAEKFCRELKQAPFSQTDATLNGAGACTGCPHRTGNLQKAEPEAYAGARTDVCTNVDCYREKAAAWQERAAAAAAAKGHSVLDAKEAAKVLGPGGLKWGTPYVDLAEHCWNDEAERPRTYKRLLEDHVEPAEIVVAFDERGEQHKLVAKKTAAKILKREHGIDLSTETYGRARRETKEDRAKRLLGERIKRESDEAVLGACAEAVLSQAGEALAFCLRRALVHVVNTEWGTAAETMLKRRGCAGKNLTERRKTFAASLSGMAAPELHAALCEIVIARAQQQYDKADYEDWLERLGVDAKAIAKAVKARIQTEEKAKAKKGGKRGR